MFPLRRKAVPERPRWKTAREVALEKAAADRVAGRSVRKLPWEDESRIAENEVAETSIAMPVEPLEAQENRDPEWLTRLRRDLRSLTVHAAGLYLFAYLILLGLSIVVQAAPFGWTLSEAPDGALVAAYPVPGTVLGTGAQILVRDPDHARRWLEASVQSRQADGGLVIRREGAGADDPTPLRSTTKVLFTEYRWAWLGFVHAFITSLPGIALAVMAPIAHVALLSNARRRGLPQRLVHLVTGTYALTYILFVLPTLALPLWGSALVVQHAADMIPEVPPSSLIVAIPIPSDSLVENQTVVFADPARRGQWVLSRIVRQNSDGSFVTRRDALGRDDPQVLKPGAHVLTGEFHLAFLGPALEMSRSTIAIVLLLICAAVWYVTIPKRPRATNDGGAAGI